MIVFKSLNLWKNKFIIYENYKSMQLQMKTKEKEKSTPCTYLPT